jgi:hypothetical protein
MKTVAAAARTDAGDRLEVDVGH